MSTPDLTRLAWLADAPLFIDAPQIERFYDAVIRPNYIQGITTATVSNTGEFSFGGEVGGKGSFEIGGGLLARFLGGKGSGEISGKATTGQKNADANTQQVQWLPVRTPQRQLGQLVLNYAQVAPDRLLEFAPVGDSKRLYDPTTPNQMGQPRAVVVLDLLGCEEAARLGVDATRLFPMAAELADGRVTLLFELLRDAQMKKVSGTLDTGDAAKIQQVVTTLAPQGGGGPGAPDSVAGNVQQSWEKYAPMYEAWDGMKVIEDGVGGQRIRWIDFQLAASITAKQKNIHLHISPGGEFDTGVFAYNFAFRAYHYGVRIVATLKAGPDLNVLAIYEK
ncbi:MAG TPA: hypothetical protein VH092_05545 [Urbifossiella sp.]|jgi:hypothetical protein|nr:hypothetical protein [Urbifossiella sp.]